MINADYSFHIAGEEESVSKLIGEDINLVVQESIDQLAEDRGLDQSLKSHLTERFKEKIRGTKDRTYLWVYLVFDRFQYSPLFEKKKSTIDSMIDTLPKSVYEAYDKILGRFNDVEIEQNVRGILSILLAADRPLTIAQMNIAFGLTRPRKSKCFQDLDLENDKDFEETIRNWCGLFISISDGKVNFLHQTAREFLLPAHLSSPSFSSRWLGSIRLEQAHSIFAEICVIYLNFRNIESQERPHDFSGQAGCYEFFDYTASTWVVHFRQASADKMRELTSLASRLCDTNSANYANWFEVYRKTHAPLRRSNVSHLTDLMISSYLELDNVVEWLLPGKNVSSQNERGETALMWASRDGSKSIVQLLLKQGADVVVNDMYRRTALHWAADQGKEEATHLLLKAGADVMAKDIEGRIPLHLAVNEGREVIVALLADCQYQACLELKDLFGLTPLHLAVRATQWLGVTGEVVTKQLLKTGASCDTSIIEEARASQQDSLVEFLQNPQDHNQMRTEQGATGGISAKETTKIIIWGISRCIWRPDSIDLAQVGIDLYNILIRSIDNIQYMIFYK